MSDDIFKTWTDAQKRLWEGFSTILPTLRPAVTSNWRETYLNTLATWESTIKQSLQIQASSLQQWTRSIVGKHDTPNMPEWNRQVDELMTRWVQTQTQLWDEWFELMRSSGIVQLSAEIGTAVEQPAEAAQEPAAEHETQLAPAVEAVTETPMETLTPAQPYPTDDLKTISGIGPKLEEKLNAQGIVSYQQLAQLNEEDIDRLEKAIMRVPGRIRRDQWIEQAKQQHQDKYGSVNSAITGA